MGYYSQSHSITFSHYFFTQVDRLRLTQLCWKKNKKQCSTEKFKPYGGGLQSMLLNYDMSYTLTKPMIRRASFIWELCRKPKKGREKKEKN